MIEISDIVKKSRLFFDIPDSVIKSYIIPKGNVISCPRDTVLFDVDDSVGNIMVLVHGRIRLVIYMENGDQILQNVLTPPGIVGIDLVSTRTGLAPYRAMASEDSELFSFPAYLILDSGFLPEQERLKCLKNLLVIISHANMQKEYRLAILTRHSLRDRILVYLSMQSAKKKSNSFSIPFSRDEMASYLSVNRSALSHELSLLRDEGVIDFRKNRFILLTRNSRNNEI